MEATALPLIATNRQQEQGGHRPQEESQRVRTLLDAARLGFEYADMELTTADLQSSLGELKEVGVTPIISFHDFTQTPSTAELKVTMRSQIQRGAEVCKLVTTANEVADNIMCLMATWEMSKNAKVVCFALGEKGLVSRVLSPLFGGQFTYASLEDGMETAPGQPSISDLRSLYRLLGVE